MVVCPTKVQTRSVLSGSFSSALLLIVWVFFSNNQTPPTPPNKPAEQQPLVNAFQSAALGQLPSAASCR